MPNKVAFLVDGWFFNRSFFNRNFPLKDGNHLLKYCRTHLAAEDRLFRIYFYDTEPYQGEGTNPASGKRIDFSTTFVARDQNTFLQSLKRTPFVDLRLGRAIFDNQWVIQSEYTHGVLSGEIDPKKLTEREVKPAIRQKGVDMMLGLDLASLVLKRLVDRIVIVSADSDMAPAAQFARNEGVQIVLDPLGNPPVGIHLEESVDEVKTNFSDYLKACCNVRIIKKAENS